MWRLGTYTRNILKSVDISIIIIVAIVASTERISLSSYVIGGYEQKIEFFKPIIERLIKKGTDSSFIYAVIADPRTKFNEKYVKINVTGYLKKADYSQNYNAFSVRKCREFIRNNLESLNRCENRFGVPKEVIASILWVETKQGAYLGDNHIASVLLSTAMSDQPQFIELNRRELRENFSGDSSKLKELDNKIKTRAVRKSQWAINELYSLSRINKVSTIQILDLTGSWAGAFGLSQFLPSSYLSWAIDGNGDGVVDLFNTDDAIFSVANYLKKNGWSDTQDSWRKAVYNYNNSKDYVDAVLKLASKLEISSYRETTKGGGN
jgi:membrane-bound lytic murein transglycosylase B